MAHKVPDKVVPGGVIRSGDWGPTKGALSQDLFDSLLKEQKLGIDTGSTTAVFILKSKASKHFGGAGPDTFPKWEEDKGEHTFLAFDTEHQMQEWAGHIVVSQCCLHYPETAGLKNCLSD